MKTITPFLLFCILAFIAPLNPAPPYASSETDRVRTGTIVLDEEFAKQIANIENLLRSDPDMKAERQAAFLTWLADLYDSTSQFKEVEKCYARILSFFPHDVGTLNRYARFLLEREGEVENALLQLKKAQYYSKSTKAKALDRGRTELLLGKLDMIRNRPDMAIEHLWRSVNLFRENAALQVTALSALYQALFQSQEYERALPIYLKLVGKKKSFDKKDIEKIELLMNLSEGQRDEDAKALAARAIEEERELERKSIEELGATPETISSPYGYDIEAVFYRRSHEGAVLLVPSPDNDRSSYRVLSQLLASSEISCLVIDSGSSLPVREFSSNPETLEGPYPKQSGDIYAGVELLKEELGTNEEKIVIVAAGRSSEMTELAIHRYRLQCPVLYLSPIFSKNDRDFANALAFRKERPSYIIYSLEDRLSLLSVSFFRKIKPIKTFEALSLEKAGHGEEMLQLSPKALEASYDWIRKTLGKGSK